MTPEAKIVAIKPVSPVLPLRASAIPAKNKAVPVVLPAQPEPETADKEGPKRIVWRFAKLMGVAEVIRFKDGSTFQFRLIKRNNAPGYSPTSSVETSDKALAENLREAAKTNRTIREAPPIEK